MQEIPSQPIPWPRLHSDPTNFVVKLADFGHGERILLLLCRSALGSMSLTRAATWANNHLLEDIQPPALRAPEVVIGLPWDRSVDVWSLGCLVSTRDLTHGITFKDTRLIADLRISHGRCALLCP